MWRNKLAHSYGVREVPGAGPGTPTMKSIPRETQSKVRDLRKLGKSHRDIANKLKIGLGTAFYYSSSVNLTKRQHQQLKIQTYKKGLGKLTKKQRRVASVKGGINNAKNVQPKYSRDYLLNLLKKFSTLNGRIPTKRDFMNIYGSFIRTFGTWNNAIKEAGFSPNPVLFAKKYIANDGHKCDSLAEKIIDDWLIARHIPHERNIPYDGTKYTADFRVGDNIIEFFGLRGQLRSYDRLMKKKLELIKNKHIKFIAIYPDDLFPKSRLDSILKAFTN